MDLTNWIASSLFVAPFIFASFAVLAYFAFFASLKRAKCIAPSFILLSGLILWIQPNDGLYATSLQALLADAGFHSSSPLIHASLNTLTPYHLVQLLGAALSFSGFVFLVSVFIPRKENELKKTSDNHHQLLTNHRKLQDDLDRNNIEIQSLNTEIDTLMAQHYSQEQSGSKSIGLYRDIFDKSAIFYISLSDSNQINDINKFACRKLGYSFGELVNFCFLDLVVAEERARVGLILDKIHSAKRGLSEFETCILDHSRARISIIVQPHIIDDGDIKTLYLFCQDISESKKLSAELVHQATHDELTQLMNRRALQAYFEKELATPEKMARVSLIYVDMDQFKVVNDTCGHTAGDQLLKQVVSIMNTVCNENHAAVFARIGGDEFAIVLLDMDKNASNLVAEQLRNAVEDFTFVWENKSFRQSISVGVALSDNLNRSFNELLSAADAACYSAKENGRNQVKICHVGENESLQDHRSSMLWVSRIEKGMSQDDFSLNFQPIVQLDKPFANYIHYEVLLQHTDEYGRITPPGNFLPSAERFGKATDIDLWVMTETFNFLEKNTEHTRLLNCCSINLTSHSIANERSRGAILSLVELQTFPVSKICFEITETSAISNLPEAIDFIAALRSLGCRFALDDFGTGFSSFGYLKNLDVDYLKIDGSFVRDIVDDKIDKVMITAISEIAREMGIKTVAEYVENEQILRELRTVNVDLGQGFGIAKPMPIDAIHEFYHQRPPLSAHE